MVRLRTPGGSPWREGNGGYASEIRGTLCLAAPRPTTFRVPLYLRPFFFFSLIYLFIVSLYCSLSLSIIPRPILAVICSSRVALLHGELAPTEKKESRTRFLVNAHRKQLDPQL